MAGHLCIQGRMQRQQRILLIWQSWDIKCACVMWDAAAAAHPINMAELGHTSVPV